MLNGCTTTRIYCRPNCPPGRRTLASHRVSFANADEARQAGFRACRVCLPDDGPPGAWVPKRQRAAAALPSINAGQSRTDVILRSRSTSYAGGTRTVDEGSLTGTPATEPHHARA